MKKICLFLSAVFLASAASAVCPVCTLAIGAGLTTLEILGVDILIAGIWAGAFTLAGVFVTAKWLNKKRVKNSVWYLADLILWYGFLASVYFLPGFKFGVAKLWGIDKLLLGIVVGSVVFYAAERFNAYLRKKNGGKSRFILQKVIVPVAALGLATLLFASII